MNSAVSSSGDLPLHAASIGIIKSEKLSSEDVYTQLFINFDGVCLCVKWPMVKQCAQGEV